jgi:hypothetical protein
MQGPDKVTSEAGVRGLARWCVPGTEEWNFFFLFFLLTNNSAAHGHGYKALELSQVLNRYYCMAICDESTESTNRRACKEPWAKNRAPAVIPSASFCSGDRRLNGGACGESHVDGGVGDQGSEESGGARMVVDEAGTEVVVLVG